MQKLTVHPFPYLKGTVNIPPSKSHTHRALIFAAFADGESVVENLLLSPDTYALIEALRQLRATIRIESGTAYVQGIGGAISQTDRPLHMGNSGIALRFLTALSALSSSPIEITGDESICHQRPMLPLVEALTALGAVVESNKGYAPIKIHGPITQKTVSIEGQDSQFVSALLILSSFLKRTIEIHVTNPGEKPWVDLTLHWLSKLHVPYERDGYERYTIKGTTIPKGFKVTIPGDFSTAAFPLAAALITRSPLSLSGLNFSDSQGDKRIFEIAEEMGAVIKYGEKSVMIHPPDVLKGVNVDINDCVDVLPILSVIACYATTPSSIRGAAITRTKECDRIDCIVKELNRMGGELKPHPDGVDIEPKVLRGGEASSHGDHRLAMALSIAGLGATGATVVDDIECIAKTYPQFIEDFQSLGGKFEFA
jgi:3-phosphoshikimate 1-carboxyvinyltransferase